STIKAIELDGKQLEEAFAPMSVTILLNDDIDISRGDMIVRDNNKPQIEQDIEAMICWLGDQPLRPNGKYALKHTTRDARAVIKDIKYKLDIGSLHRITENPEIAANDIGRISIRTTAPLMYDPYTRNRETGSFILIDEGTNVTVGAGIILD
ncbi:MAG: sulfate adenylyltransferase, partial [Bacteroidetes bacterium]|nr:sulfate adenylyltransferase [Bacteroidota bacterium]